MKWLELHIDTTHAGLDTVEAMLSGLGIDNVVIDDETEFQDFLENNHQYWDYVDEELEEKMHGASRVTFYLSADEEGFAKMGEVRIALQALKERRTDCGSLLMTVDDLNHLKRGGRINAATALFGTMLAIKPVMHVDDEGRLIPVSKARGRKASLLALVDEMEKTAIDPKDQTVFISHGDCLADAEFVAGEVRRRFGTEDVRINYVGPVIGNHSGPGTLALFFLGTQR